MLFKVGDLVTRISHQNDMVFKIIELHSDVAILKGVNVRLIADAFLDDLVLYSSDGKDQLFADDARLFDAMKEVCKMDRDEYFYLPGKILHIDADEEYLKRCMKFYHDMNILSYGLVLNESEIAKSVGSHLMRIRPDVLVITGHDAYFDRSKDGYLDMNNYKNSANFVDAVMQARKYENDHEKLIIIAGACQSNYEELIKAGANFASSPKRINIHALDPAIVASSVSLANRNKPIDLLRILEKTKYGKDGMGGIITNGTMYVGYPR